MHNVISSYIITSLQKLHSVADKTAHCKSQETTIMLLIEAIENHLGQIDSWASYILHYLFLDHPPPVRSAKLKKIISFFYGNDIPCNLASRFH
jgi:hypothetical protein